MDQINGLAGFPDYRPRRLRRTETLRRLVRENTFSLDQLVMPYFITEGKSVKEPIAPMPGQFRFSTDTLLSELSELTGLGVSSILLFGVPEKKDECAKYASAKDGIIQRSVAAIKNQFPDLLVITDVCLCAYTTHGHCGILNKHGEIENDGSLEILAKTAASHAEAGADIVAPSDMMDGRIRAIRRQLDENGFQTVPILSYAAKYASAFYGPFRDAAHSVPQSVEGQKAPSDRKTYQMDPANREEALREIALDIAEGADMVMVKPALAYLDILREVKNKFQFPLAAYAVSGEYAMVKAAAEKGMIDEKNVVLEMMTALKRAGADVLISYHTRDIASWLHTK